MIDLHHASSNGFYKNVRWLGIRMLQIQVNKKPFWSFANKLHAFWFQTLHRRCIAKNLIEHMDEFKFDVFS